MNLGELKALLISQSRSDAPGVVSNATTWLNIAQLRVCRDLPPNGWWFTEIIEPTSVGSDGSIALSRSPLQVREVFLGVVRLLRIQSTGSHVFAGLTTPSAFYVSGDKVVLVPPGTPGAPCKVVYDAALPALVNDSDHNELSDTFPDIYIAAAMVDVALHLGRVGDVQVWEARYQQCLKDLQALNYRRRGRLVGDV